MNKAYKKGLIIKDPRHFVCQCMVNLKIHERVSTRVFKRDFSYSPYPPVNEAVCFLFHFTSQFVTLSSLRCDLRLPRPSIKAAMHMIYKTTTFSVVVCSSQKPGHFYDSW